MNQPLAFIHPEAKLGANIVVEPFAYISKNVEIGEGTWVGPNVTILDHVKIGKNCKIFPGAVVGAIPQDLKFRGEESYVEIGDNTTLRECVTVNRGTAARITTKVGNNCLLMAYVHVAHDSIVGNNVILGNGTQLAGEVEIDDFAILSAHVLVHQFVRIGSHVMVSGGSLVRKDIPPYVKAGKEPISYVGLNVIGLRRRGFNPEKVAEIHEIFRSIYQKGMNVSQGIEWIENNIPSNPDRDYIVNFIKSSKRGIIRSGLKSGGSSIAEDDD